MSAQQFGFGSGILYGIRTDVANATPVIFGVLQDVAIEFDAEAKSLYGQNQFPVDVARGKAKITGKAKLGRISPALFNNMFFGQTLTTGQTLFAYNETATIGAVVTGTTSATTSTSSAVLHFVSTPAGVTVGASIADGTAGSAIPAGTYVIAKDATTVTMSANAAGAGVGSGDTINFGPIASPANVATFSQDLGPLYASTGAPFQKVASNPSVGQYVLSAGVYSFNSSEAAVPILLNYTYSAASTGSTITGINPLMGDTPRFKTVFNQRYGGNTLSLTLNSCVASKLSMPTKLDDYTIPEIDFEAFADASGNVFSLSTTGA